MEQIKWWPHARERLLEREIDEKMVQAALQQPDQEILVGKRRIIHKRYHDPQCNKEYLLRVFIEECPEGQIVCTVYRTSKISKYWRDDL